MIEVTKQEIEHKEREVIKTRLSIGREGNQFPPHMSHTTCTMCPGPALPSWTAVDAMPANSQGVSKNRPVPWNASVAQDPL